MVFSTIFTLLLAASAPLGVHAGPCVPSVTSMTSAATTLQTSTTTAPPTATTTTSEPIITSFTVKLFRHSNVRRDDEEESGSPVLSLGKGVSIEEDAEYANNGDDYV
ncbi:hypothetical protein BGZ63DRAFT_383136 [Mariannaea sp. PMI_226]|nr:hypothetical protein BGZ63DRAFT_383136 [Mariannaea sp. PMI_226]